MTIIDENNFNSDVIDKHSKDKESFVLYFSSDNCVFCEIIDRILKNSNTKNTYKINISQNKKFISKYLLRSTPTIMFFDNNLKLTKRIIGATNSNIKELDNVLKEFK